MKKTILLIGCLLLIFHSENIRSQNKDFKAGIYNIGIGAIVGGIGAVINKKKDQRTSKIFLKGFKEGALGGYLLFESKRLIREFGRKENYIFAWSSKLLNSAGNSIIENAIENNRFGEKWNFTFGFNRFEFTTKNRFKIKYKVMPFSLYSTFYFGKRGRFNIHETLKTGHFIFTSLKIKSPESNLQDIEGYAFTNNITILKNSTINKFELLSHEIIHSYQYENLSVFNKYFNKLRYRTKQKNKLLNLYQKVFYTDFNYPIFHIMYQQQIRNFPYDSRPFEKEANYFEK